MNTPAKTYARLHALIAPIALCLLLSACAQGSVDVTVNADGTADIRMDATLDESALDTIGQSGLPEQIASGLREQGLDARAVSRDGQSGISASRTVQLEGGTLPDMPEGITVEDRKEEGLFSTTHRILVIVDPPELIPSESSSLTGFIGSRLLGRFVENEFDFDFTVSLPIKPGENNADEVSADGRTLSWDIAATRESRIELAVAVPNIRRTVYAASAALILVVALAAFLLLRRKRKKRTMPPASPPR